MLVFRLLTFQLTYNKKHDNCVHLEPRNKILLITKNNYLSQQTCETIRDFSNKYCSIFAPSIAPRLSKCISIYFPNRDELSFRTVFAFPKARRKRKLKFQPEL